VIANTKTYIFNHLFLIIGPSRLQQEKTNQKERLNIINNLLMMLGREKKKGAEGINEECQECAQEYLHVEGVLEAIKTSKKIEANAD